MNSWADDKAETFWRLEAWSLLDSKVNLNLFKTAGD